MMNSKSKHQCHSRAAVLTLWCWNGHFNSQHFLMCDLHKFRPFDWILECSEQQQKKDMITPLKRTRCTQSVSVYKSCTINYFCSPTNSLICAKTLTWKIHPHIDHTYKCARAPSATFCTLFCSPKMSLLFQTSFRICILLPSLIKKKKKKNHFRN